MFCRHCGTPNDDNAFKCVSCGKIVQDVAAIEAPRRPAPETYLAFAIVVTLICCMPLGIVAIVYAAQVNAKANVGDYAGAELSARKAKMWCWWSFGVGMVGLFFYAVLFTLASLFAK